MRLNKILNILIRIYFVLFAMLTATVTICSLITTLIFRQNEQNDLFDFTRENLPLLLVGMAAVILLFYLLAHRTRFFTRAVPNQKGVLIPGPGGILMLAFAGAFCLGIVLTTRAVATNDALQLDAIMNAFMQGDYSAFAPGEYLASYPFQLGYILVGQILYLVVGPSCYLAYQILNIISILFTLYFLYQMTWEIFEKERVAEIMALLSVGMVFLYIYSTYVYNDIWSLAPQTAALYLQVRFMKRGKVSDEIFAGIQIAVASLLKTNCYIALVAMVLTLMIRLVRGLKQTDRNKITRHVLLHLGLALSLVVMTFGLIRIVNTAYCKAAGLDALPPGVTTSSYLAMGMQEMEGKYGWYDGYNVGILHESGEDAALADLAARENMKESLRSFAASPRYAVKFYLFKFLSQWADPSCMAMRELEESVRHVENPSAVTDYLVFGGGYLGLNFVMNLFHSLIYLLTSIWILAHFLPLRSKKDPADRVRRISDAEAMLVMFIFGGMLFHQMWEAAGRYVIRYYISMLPLAAAGLDLLITTKLPKGVRS